MWMLILSTMEKVSFHHGGKKLSPWWKEKNPVVERIAVRYDFS
ncbi:hypothetical protein [Bacteroides oleiciplenus]|nr:hypothetical protein [Bacteroides oleiciplenus]